VVRLSSRCFREKERYGERALRVSKAGLAAATVVPDPADAVVVLSA
jgi:hypothetical protein